MSDFLEMLSSLSVAGIIILVVILLIFATVAAVYIRREIIGKSRRGSLTSKPEDSAPPIEHEDASASKSILGTGEVKCVAIRPGNIIDFTTIPELIGEVYQVDTSCPRSGAVVIVRELEDGEIVDYDPREVPVVIEQTPEYAWFATNWNIVTRFWAVPQIWWKSTSMWFAAAMMAIVFIAFLAVVGG